MPPRYGNKPAKPAGSGPGPGPGPGPGSRRRGPNAPRPRNGPQPARVAQHGFSLRDEARNTASQGAGRLCDRKLRDKPVLFVAAGNLKSPEQSIKDGSEKSASNGGAVPESLNAVGDGNNEVLTVARVPHVLADVSRSPAAVPSPAPVISSNPAISFNAAVSSDLTVSPTPAAPLAPVASTADNTKPVDGFPYQNDDAESSSDDIIVYRGRNKPASGCGDAIDAVGNMENQFVRIQLETVTDGNARKPGKMAVEQITGGLQQMAEPSARRLEEMLEVSASRLEKMAQPSSGTGDDFCAGSDVDFGDAGGPEMRTPAQAVDAELVADYVENADFQVDSAAAALLRPTDYAGSVMDWDSVATFLPRRQKKGGPARPTVDDPVLDAKLEKAWQNDRLKKRERKEAKLRAASMSKAVNPEDPQVKYQDGMSVADMCKVVGDFLRDEKMTYAFPPLSKHARRVIHEVASTFQIKSRSAGSGSLRHPVMMRTVRTAKYDSKAVDDAFARFGRKYFPRMGSKGRRKGGNASGVGATVCSDGDVVGGTAPELSVNNRGRTMLEKMGWSTGTALGTVDNKGILQPVMHTVKRTKMGLGGT